jgi:Xylose isomerase-like TIM barrel
LFEASIDAHFLGHAQDSLAKGQKVRHPLRAQSADQEPAPVSLRSDEPLCVPRPGSPHGQSIQNLGCHIRSATYFFTRRLSTIIPSSGLTCRELNTSTVYVSFIAFTLKRTIQPAQVVEALNDFDTPRYLLTNTHGTIQLLAEVNRPNLKYRYDIYHIQRMEGNLIAILHQHVGQIEHIQVVDPPGRHGPGTGEIHYLNVLAALDAAGHQGYLGLEYNPTTSSETSFAWLPEDRSGKLAGSDLCL